MKAGRAAIACGFSTSSCKALWAEENGQVDDLSTSPRKVDISRRVHILGLGNVGTFVAHSLAGVPNRPPITLLLKGSRHAQRWEEAKGMLKITTEGVTETRTGFDVEFEAYEKQSFRRNRSLVEEIHARSTSAESQSETQPHEDTTENFKGLAEHQEHANTNPPSELVSSVDREVMDNSSSDPLTADHSRTNDVNQEARAAATRISNLYDGTGEPTERMVQHESHIYNLIVTTKAYATAKALRRYAHRLTPESTVLFLQNGMGVIDEVNELCFPDPENRPQYMMGINSHGLKRRVAGQFDVVHAGAGTLAVGILPGNGTSNKSMVESTASARYLLRTMVRVPVFVAVGFPPSGLLQQQLDKLAVNAIINPVTAVLNIKNGALLENYGLTRVIRLLLAEISLVIRSLPELENVPNVNMRFDSLRLERLVMRVAKLTAENDSSMLQDVRVHGQTEIDYLNGYIIKRGEQLGIQCALNYMLMHLIKAKGTLINKSKEGLLPFGYMTKAFAKEEP